MIVSRSLSLDGFPRTMDQVLEFERTIGRPRFVLYFSCPFETLERRLLERGRDSGRKDDNLDTIRLRFQTFEAESIHAIHYYESKSMLVTISSTPPVDQVFNVAQKYFLRLPFEGERIIFVMGCAGSGKGKFCHYSYL